MLNARRTMFQTTGGSAEVVYRPLSAIGHYSSSTLTTRFIFCLYAIGSLQYTAVILDRRLLYLLDLKLRYKTRVIADPDLLQSARDYNLVIRPYHR